MTEINGPDIAKGEPFAFRLERSAHGQDIFIAVPMNVCDNPACDCRDLGMAVYRHPGEGQELSGAPVYSFVLDLKNRSIQSDGYGTTAESLAFGASFLDHSDFALWDLLARAFDHLKEEAIRKKFALKGTSASIAGRIEPIGNAKVGRNDLCPCGSGKKFKNCCG